MHHAMLKVGFGRQQRKFPETRAGFLDLVPKETSFALDHIIPNAVLAFLPFRSTKADHAHLAQFKRARNRRKAYEDKKRTQVPRYARPK